MYQQLIARKEEEDLIIKFKKGIDILKHGRQGNPHLRHFTLSKTLDKISYRDPKDKKGEVTTVNVTDIKDIQSGCESKVFKRVATKKREEISSKCLTITLPDKTLDLEFDSEKDRKDIEKIFKVLVSIKDGKRDEKPDRILATLHKWHFDLLADNWKVSKVLSKGEKMTDEEVAHIAAAIDGNDILKNIDFKDSNISDTGTFSLAQSFANCVNPATIDLSQNIITDQGFNKILKSFTQMKGLKVLNFSENKISDVGAETLAHLLAAMRSLEEVYLDKNQIGTLGAKSLAKEIKEHRPLKVFSLNDNLIENEGAIDLITTMKSKKNLTCRIARNKLTFGEKTVDDSEQPLEVQLFLAVDNQDYAEVVTLLLSGADPNVQNEIDGKTPIHIASIRGDLELLEFISENPKVDINLADDNGLTPVYCAMEAKQYKVVTFLLEHNADYKSTNKNKKTLLHLACEQGNKAFVKTLVEKYGMDIYALTNNLETPLILSASAMQYSTLEYLVQRDLLEHKSSKKNEDPTSYLNFQDANGDTALHKVFQAKGDIEIAKLLVSNGAEISIENKSGKTPLSNATEADKSILLLEARKYMSTKMNK